MKLAELVSWPIQHFSPFIPTRVGKVCFHRCVCHSPNPNKHIQLVAPKKPLNIALGIVFAETGVAMAIKTEIIVCADITDIMPFLIVDVLRKCFRQSIKRVRCI